MGCIYAHILKDTNSDHYDWWYIGQAEDLEKRWSNISNYKGSPFIYSALKKYGWDAFEHIVLEDNVATEKLDEREEYWIQYYHTFVDDPEYKKGFNLTSGGNGSRGPKYNLRNKIPKNIPQLTALKYKEIECINSGEWHDIHFSKDQTWDSVQECAAYFHVSHSAISWRLHNADKLLSGPIFVATGDDAEFNAENLEAKKEKRKTEQIKRGKDLASVRRSQYENNYNILCEETGKVYTVVSDCLKDYNMSRSTLNGHLNHPDKHKTAKGFHFRRVPKTGAYG